MGMMACKIAISRACIADLHDAIAPRPPRRTALGPPSLWRTADQEGRRLDVEALVRAGLGNRLMFGSDQMRWPEKIDEAIEAIEEADYLTAGQKRDILYNNAARFLRLDGGRK